MPEAVIVDALRTPIGRHAGVLSGVPPDDLAAHVIQAAVERGGLDPASVDDVYMGATNAAGEDNRNVARMASLLAGLPVEVPGVTTGSARPASRRSCRAPARSVWATRISCLPEASSRCRGRRS